MRKSDTIYNWKKRGLIGDYDKIYDKYISTTNCELCNVILTDGKPINTSTKNMNHNHLTGYFINIICHKCNQQNDRQLIRKRIVGKTKRPLSIVTSVCPSRALPGEQMTIFLIKII